MDWTAPIPFLSDEDVQAARAEAQKTVEHMVPAAMHEGIVIIAFQVNGASNMHRQTLVMNELAKIDLVDVPAGAGVEAWWVAMDERYDGNDCESAVLVKQGLQATVQQTLITAGVSDPADSALTNPGEAFHKPQPEGEVG